MGGRHSELVERNKRYRDLDKKGTMLDKLLSFSFRRFKIVACCKRVSCGNLTGPNLGGRNIR